MEGLWSRVTDQGHTCAAASFQMGHPGTIPLPAPCSLGNYNSSRKEDALSLYTGEGGGKAGQALACQDGPGPTPTKTGIDQTIGMLIKPVLRCPKS